MKNGKQSNAKRFSCARWLGGAALSTWVALPAGAVAFLEGGDWVGQFDTTITYGLAVRTEHMDPVNAGAYGNRAYDKWDTVKNALSAQHELRLDNTANGYGLFMRGAYFYDFRLDDVPLNNAAENRAVQHGDVLDAFVYSNFLNNDLTLRFGRQVISWGESTFIGSSLNDINTFDVSKSRSPGVELKEILLPTHSLYGLMRMPAGFSLEAFYLFEFDNIKLDPSGSFWSTSDAVADGGGGRQLAPDGRSTAFAGLVRGPNDRPRSGDQYGIALRYYNPGLGKAGSEIALYYQRLHDHIFSFSTIAGSGQFILDYPDRIERYGASFNTLVGSFLVAGEYSYRRNAPLQGLDFYQVAFPKITPVGSAMLPFLPANLTAASAGDKVNGYTSIKRHQAQITVQKNWVDAKPWFKSGSVDTLAEVAYTRADLPSAREFNLLNPVTTSAWGFVINNSLTYNDLWNGFNVIPALTFRWDVNGVASDGLFVEGRKAATIGFTWNRRVTWKGSLNYTTVWGGENIRNNFNSRMVSDRDRDFISLDVGYSF